MSTHKTHYVHTKGGLAACGRVSTTVAIHTNVAEVTCVRCLKLARRKYHPALFTARLKELDL